MISRRNFCQALAAGAAMLAGPAWAAAPTPATDGRRRINLAARQGMLSQQIVKSAGFAALGVTPAAQISYVRGSAELFEKTLRALRDGNDAFGLVPEPKTAVLIELAKVERAWVDYRAAIDAFLSANDPSAGSLDDLVARNGEVLAAAENHALSVERSYGGTDLPLHIAVAISIAGRQRMLTQKMGKDYALIALGIDAEANRTALAQSVELFGNSLAGLIDGFPMVGLQPAKGAELRERLATVRELWIGLKPALDAIAAGALPSQADIVRISWETNPLLVAMNQAVFLFEEEEHGT